MVENTRPKPSSRMDPVETVLVGDGRRLVTELHRRLDEVFRMRSSVEKGEVGVTVQLAYPLTQCHFSRTVVRPL